MREFLKSVFSGCLHSWGRPISVKNGHRCHPYRVCTECGRERKYDMHRMAFVR